MDAAVLQIGEEHVLHSADYHIRLAADATESHVQRDSKPYARCEFALLAIVETASSVEDVFFLLYWTVRLL